jgi:hypothetical protein
MLSSGCIGGNLYSAMDLSLYHGIPLESAYPFSPQAYYPGICTISHGPTFPNSRRITAYNLNFSKNQNNDKKDNNKNNGISNKSINN